MWPFLACPAIPKPPSRPLYSVSSGNLKSRHELPALDFPIEVCISNFAQFCCRIPGANFHHYLQVDEPTYQAISAALQKAPFGRMEDLKRPSDWRSWEAFHNKQWSLAAILLHQKFPESIPSFQKHSLDRVMKKHSDVQIPQLPKQAIKLLP